MGNPQLGQSGVRLNSEVVASRRPVTFYIYRDTDFFFGEFFKD